MIEYPTIGRVVQHIPVWVFDKLDGSHIRVEWSRKRGFHKFGSRHQLIDNTHFLGEAIELVQQQRSESNKILKDLRLNKAVLFFEFFGEHSFAGNHIDEEHRVVLLDVFGSQGLMQANDFRKHFEGNVPTPTFLHHGYVNEELINKIKENKLVVCKSWIDG